MYAKAAMVDVENFILMKEMGKAIRRDVKKSDFLVSNQRAR
jgi:hypothetical protein